jgi:hypothetical protein
MELTFFHSSEKKPRALSNQFVKRLIIAVLGTLSRKEHLDVVDMLNDRQSVFVHFTGLESLRPTSFFPRRKDAQTHEKSAEKAFVACHLFEDAFQGTNQDGRT